MESEDGILEAINAPELDVLQKVFQSVAAGFFLAMPAEFLIRKTVTLPRLFMAVVYFALFIIFLGMALVTRMLWEVKTT